MPKIKMINSFRPPRVFILLFLFSAIFVSLFKNTYALDKIVAIVNNDIITQKDLDDFLNFMRVQLSNEYRGQALEEKVRSLKMDLLNKLIEDKLILEQAKKNEIKVDESRIKARLAEFKSHYPSEAVFQKELVKQGLVQSDLERKMREQLLMYYVVDMEVRRKVTVRPEEVTSFYQANIKDFMTPEERHLEVVILENQDLANSFYYNYSRGEKLQDLAARYPLTVDEISVFKGGELRKDVEEQIFKLSLTEISRPINIGNKFYIFKLNDIIAPRQMSLSEAQDKIHLYLFDKKMQEQLAKWLDELKKKAYIQIKQN